MSLKSKFLSMGFTGTQKGMNDYQKNMVSDLFSFLSVINNCTLHHGDCVGSDEEAHEIARLFRFDNVHLHPPDNPKYRAFCDYDFISPELPYLERNKEIVKSSDVLIATPNTYNEVLRSGTWATIRHAIKKEVPVLIFLPNGKKRRVLPNK